MRKAARPADGSRARAVQKKREAHADDVMPGYTHLQRAQPITFGHHLMAYAEMFLRDLSRLEDAQRRMNVCPLGSGALAGRHTRWTAS